jgi:putative membrane protein
MFYDGGWFMGGMHFLWWIFWVAIIAAFVWTLWGRPGGRASDTDRTVERRETPLELLQRRLANGDCTPEEYEKRKTLLERDRSTTP